MRDAYFVNREGLDSIYSRLYNNDIHSLIELKDSVRSIYYKIVSGDHDPDSASAVNHIHQRLCNEFERYVCLTGVMMKAIEIYSNAENQISLKTKLGYLIIDKWDVMGVGAAGTLFSKDLTVNQLANLGGYNYLEPYQQRAYNYTTSKYNAALFLGYGFTNTLNERGDAFWTVFYNMFDTADSQTKGVFTNEGYDYEKTRGVLESLVKNYSNSDENVFEIVFEDSKIKEVMKACKFPGKWEDFFQKYIEGDKEINEAIDGLRDSTEKYDGLIGFMSDTAKVFKYGELGSKVITPWLTNYQNSIATLESMRRCDLFGDASLQNRVIDDMIHDYKNKIQISIKEVAEFGVDKAIDYGMNTNPITGAVKFVDASIDALGAVTGGKSYTKNLQDYWTYSNLSDNVQNSFQNAFEKLSSGNYSEADVLKFEDSFRLNRAFFIKMCETEKEIIQHKLGSSPSDGNARSALEDINRQITQLENMKLSDASTWKSKDGKVFSFSLKGT